MNFILVIGLMMLSMLVYIQGQIRERKLQKLLEHQQRETLAMQERLDGLEQRSEFLRNSALGVGDRLIGVEKKVQHELQEQVAHNSQFVAQPSEEQLYRQQADRLLKGRQLPSTPAGGVSRSEAKLMALVGNKKTTD